MGFWFMLIGSRQKLSTLYEYLKLSIDNVPIKQVSTTKSLGILSDDNMAWHSHIGKLSKLPPAVWHHKAN